MNIDICICTFRRPHVAKTLVSIAAAFRPKGARLRIVVADNDARPSAEASVRLIAETIDLPVIYLHAPDGNISIARNAALGAAAEADWVAFVDDDEIVDADWLTALVTRQAETGADAVFGHARAIYGADAPAWMVAGDFHSQFAGARGDVIETGHTCNALLRWGGTPWADARFDLGRGRSGGEDTEFFFRLRRMGARYAIAPDSIVREAVPASRARLGWLLLRRFRFGQSYAAIAQSWRHRVALMGGAAVKSSYCWARAATASFSPRDRAFWLMRGTLHAGVCAGCLRLPQPVLYGEVRP